MKAQVEIATNVLVGKALWDCSRAADLASFAFGNRRRVPAIVGGTKTVGEYALHIQCAWRITREDEVIVGSRDLYYPDSYSQENRDIPSDFDWDLHPNLRDRRLRLWFGNGSKEFGVENVEGRAAAGLHIVLSGGYCLDVFPDDSLNGEYWRLFQPGSSAPHFVATWRGIEIS